MAVPQVERIESFASVAGAGFRLSLVLNAVKMKMAAADSEITRISKAISDFSLMLKQVAIVMEDGGVVATPLAIDTVFDIKEHSELVFDEIKSMSELAQIRDDEGNLTEIGVNEKVSWSFRQQKVPYLLGQLEYLRLNLAIMLQVLQLGKVVRSSRRPMQDKTMMQEHAEIQNMIVLQHWSFEDLKNLYHVANEEAKRAITASPSSESPPPSYDDPSTAGVRLAITAASPHSEEHTSLLTGPATTSMVKYEEHPLKELDDSLYHALSRENNALGAQVPDIVDHLLHEWTAPEDLPRPHKNGTRSLNDSSRSASHKSRKYQTYYSEEEDTTESEYEDPDSISQQKGYYLEGPGSRAKGEGKSVRFRGKQARVDDELDEEDDPTNPRRRRKRPSHKHVIDSDEYSSEDDSSDLSPSPPLHQPSRRTQPRRDSNSSGSRYSSSRAEQTAYARTRRPYASGPSGARHSPPDKDAVNAPIRNAGAQTQPQFQRPNLTHNSRSVPAHLAWQSGQGTPAPAPGSPGFRVPGTNLHPGAPMTTGQRLPSNPYIPSAYNPSPGASPNPPQGAFFPQAQHPRQSQQQQQRPPSRPVRGNTHPGNSSSNRESRAEKDRKSASHNLKKGIGLGAAAAGLMELLSGLDAI